MDKPSTLEICRRLHARNCLASADGNVSVRLPDGRILITPTGLNKAFLHENDIAAITIENRILSGSPSGERLMHRTLSWYLLPKNSYTLQKHHKAYRRY